MGISKSVQDILGWIDGHPVEVNFIMQVGAGAPAAVAHLSDDIAPFDFFSDFFKGFARSARSARNNM